MAIPRPTSPTEIGLVAVGSVVGLLVVLPLLPTILDFVFGPVGTVLDVILPGGDPEV